MCQVRMALLLLLVFMAWSGQNCAQKTIDLGGQWDVTGDMLDIAACRDGFSAWVPGTLQNSMVVTACLPKPYQGDEIRNWDWMPYHQATYERTFDLTAADLRADRADLTFEGIDTYAYIGINGHDLGEVHNMHRTWCYAVRPYLRVGKNRVTVVFPPLMNIAKLAYDALPFRLPSGNDDAEIKLSPFVRKAAYHFGWDFAPRLLSIGIWRPVYLQLWSGAQIAQVQAQPRKLARKAVPMEVTVDLDVAEAGHYALDITLDGVIVQTQKCRLDTGRQSVKVYFTIHDPIFWWPRGMGDPHRYALGLRLRHGTEVIDAQVQSLGLRSIRLVREKDVIGTSFYFSVNDFLPEGGPLFIKGANYVPADMSLPQSLRKQQHLLASAEAVGMNMLRVWGGGIYEDDTFYDWCDAHGMLVWQDLPFACMMYPLAGQFLENVRAEVEDNALRLRRHPSLALWCGNNEIDVAWHNWGWQAEGKYSPEFADQLWAEYQSFFEGDVPAVLRRLDPARAYIPTSPLSNWGKEENFKHHNMHYWGVWHGSDSLDGFSHYVPRFMAEYGFQSWPSPKTLQPLIAPDDWRIDSPAILHRQKSYKGNAPILRFLRALYGEPKDFSSFCLLSQLVQRDAMKLAIEAHRLAAPRCMGTLYWQLNDCWPGPSWSTIDAAGEWKPAHHALRRLYAPLLVVADLVHDSLRVRVASDSGRSNYGLRLELMTLAGEPIQRQMTSILVQPDHGSSTYFQMPIAQWAKSFDPQSSVLEVTLVNDGHTLASDRLYFVPPKDLKLPAPQLRHGLRQTAHAFQLELSSATLVKDLHVDVEGVDASFSHNDFDLLPNEPITIEIQNLGGMTQETLEKRLVFRDLSQLIH